MQADRTIHTWPKTANKSNWPHICQVVRRLLVTSHELSNRWDWIIKPPNWFENWLCYRIASQMKKWLGKSTSKSWKNSWDQTITHQFLPTVMRPSCLYHCNDVIITTMASQITSLTVVYSIVYSGIDQRKHQSSASLAFVRGIHLAVLLSKGVNWST